MAHADDDGMIVPPRIAPTHVVILPISPKPETREAVFAAADRLAAATARQPLPRRAGRGRGRQARHRRRRKKLGMDQERRAGADRDRAARPGKRNRAVARRDQAPKEKQFLPVAEAVAQIAATLQAIQDNLYAARPGATATRTRATSTRRKNFTIISRRKMRRSRRSTAASPVRTGAARAECEAQIKEDLKVTIRCIPFDAADEEGRCVFCGKASNRRVIFAKSY